MSSVVIINQSHVWSYRYRRRLSFLHFNTNDRKIAVWEFQIHHNPRCFDIGFVFPFTIESMNKEWSTDKEWGRNLWSWIWKSLWDLCVWKRVHKSVSNISLRFKHFSDRNLLSRTFFRLIFLLASAVKRDGTPQCQYSSKFRASSSDTPWVSNFLLTSSIKFPV